VFGCFKNKQVALMVDRRTGDERIYQSREFVGARRGQVENHLFFHRAGHRIGANFRMFP
jgi:hypothetical protein